MLSKSLRRSVLSGSGVSSYHEKQSDHLLGNKMHQTAPSLTLMTDKEIYRPGDLVNATIEIQSRNSAHDSCAAEQLTVSPCPFLIENLTIEIKGIEKLDTQWFITQKPLPAPKQRRGERVFLDSTSASIVSKVIISSGGTKTYIVRAELPNVLPPSYKGTAIRYFYYIRSTLRGRWLVLDNYHPNGDTLKDLVHLESRSPLHLWALPKSTSFPTEECPTQDRLANAVLRIDVLWKEKSEDSEWARVNEVPNGLEDDCDSARDEISSVASFSMSKGNLDAFSSSLSLQSLAMASGKGYQQGEGSNFPSPRVVPQVSTTEVLHESSGNLLSPVGNSTGKKLLQKKLGSCPSSVLSPNQLKRPLNSPFGNDEMGENIEMESFVRGRSYNIKIEDQILLRFSPKNSDSTYYFSDVIGGALTFFHEQGSRRCVEVSITLESLETINQPYVHPSRRHSPIITKVHSEHHEVVVDLIQTSFLFSIPMDGPMSFSTPHVSVQWSLRFEFVTTPGNVDWTRYEHPLLVEGREKGEWVLPITVQPPPSRTQSSQSRNERPLSPAALWIRT